MIYTYKLHKKSIKKAIKIWCLLGGYGIESTLDIKRYSQHRLIYSGIDLLKLQDIILKLPDRSIQAVSEYGNNEKYNRYDLDVAITILSNTIDI